MSVLFWVQHTPFPSVPAVTGHLNCHSDKPTDAHCSALKLLLADTLGGADTRKNVLLNNNKSNLKMVLKSKC